MARKISFFTIKGDKTKNRDAGKVFKLTEMNPMQSHKWAIRAFLALARGGIDIPDDIAASGLEGIASLGMKIFGSMKFEDAEPLLDEMLACVEAVPNPADRSTVTPLFDGSSIEEPSTMFTLHKAVFCLHVDFSELAALYASAVAAGKADGSPST